MTCAGCGGPVPVEPLRCPYCDVTQPDPEAGDRGFPRRIALLTVGGLLLGLACGFFGTPRSRLQRALQVESQTLRERALVERRERLRAALRRLESQGYRRVRVEELAGRFATAEGAKLALAGLLQHATLGPAGGSIELATGWGAGVRTSVEAGGLSHAQKADLLRASFPPQLYLGAGTWRGGRLRLEQGEVLGPADDKTLAWYLE